jgi:hypothetical protein
VYLLNNTNRLACGLHCSSVCVQHTSVWLTIRISVSPCFPSPVLIHVLMFYPLGVVVCLAWRS